MIERHRRSACRSAAARSSRSRPPPRTAVLGIWLGKPYWDERPGHRRRPHAVPVRFRPHEPATDRARRVRHEPARPARLREGRASSSRARAGGRQFVGGRHVDSHLMGVARGGAGPLAGLAAHRGDQDVGDLGTARTPSAGARPRGASRAPWCRTARRGPPRRAGRSSATPCPRTRLHQNECSKFSVWMPSSPGSNSLEDLLRVVGAVVAADTGVVAADDEVGAAVVLAADRVPDRLRGPA